MTMPHKVIYTCLTGTYDELRQPLAISLDYDYVCFSDSMPAGRNGVWDVRPIPFKTCNKVLLSRYPKLQPHKVLPEYDYSLYMDANVQIRTAEFYDVVNRRIAAGDLIAQVPHVERKCVYQEIHVCWAVNLISIWQNIILRFRLHRMKMPKDFGLMENNLILRKHNDPLVIEISDAWWKEFCTGPTRRDQLSLMPIYWLKKFYPSLLFGDGKNTRNVDCLSWFMHNRKRNYEKPKSDFEKYIMRLSNGAERRGWL